MCLVFKVSFWQEVWPNCYKHDTTLYKAFLSIDRFFKQVKQKLKNFQRSFVSLNKNSINADFYLIISSKNSVTNSSEK